MNRIVRKTLDGLNKIESSFNVNDKYQKETLEVINNLKQAINLDYSLNGVDRMLDAYITIEMLLYKVCNLTDDEAGYIIDKIIKFNFKVNTNQDSIIVTLDKITENGLDMNKLEKIINKLNNNEILTSDEEKIYKMLLMSTSSKNNYIKSEFKKIEDFTRKESHTEEEYISFINSLNNLGITKRMIDSYVSFYRKKEKKEKIQRTTNIKRYDKKNEVNIPSRKILKSKLNELYHPREREPYFDLKDIQEVLKLLKLLNLSDERIKITLSDLYCASIKNENYYKFLIEKIKYMNSHIEELNDITELQKLYPSSNKEEKDEIKKWLNDIYKKLEFEMINSFDYEYNYILAYKYKDNE